MIMASQAYVDQLPSGKQSVLLQTIDGFLKGEGVAG